MTFPGTWGARREALLISDVVIHALQIRTCSVFRRDSTTTTAAAAPMQCSLMGPAPPPAPPAAAAAVAAVVGAFKETEKLAPKDYKGPLEYGGALWGSLGPAEENT